MDTLQYDDKKVNYILYAVSKVILDRESEKMKEVVDVYGPQVEILKDNIIWKNSGIRLNKIDGNSYRISSTGQFYTRGTARIKNKQPSEVLTIHTTLIW